jgi:hypothetical protein
MRIASYHYLCLQIDDAIIKMEPMNDSFDSFKDAKDSLCQLAGKFKQHLKKGKNHSGSKVLCISVGV